MYERRVATLSIGLGGVGGNTIDGGSITYYDTRLRAYYGELVEGGFVIDKSKVLAEKPGLVIASPLCKGSMKPGTTDALGDVSDNFVANAIANDRNNPASVLAKLAIAGFGGFDYVAPDLYAAWWLDKGARVGTRIGDTIHWSDGIIEQIPSFEARYK
jgi:hypothetical protein